MPGLSGPVPARSDQRVRRNEPEIPIDKIPAIGPVDVPELDLGGWVHPLVSDLYEAMKNSAQSKYFEPSDWAYARLTLYVVNDMLTGVNSAGERYARSDIG